MKRLFVFALYFILIIVSSNAQKPLPQIDKAYYNATYRQHVFPNRNTKSDKVAKKSQVPVMLNGYLVIYNEDLGYFNQHPDALIEQLNEQKMFGRDNWRIPTPDELCIMEVNATTLGMGSDIYMCTSHANGCLRLVATNGQPENVVRIGDTFWAKCNFGTSQEEGAGRPLTYQEALERAPKGYRLPTEEEARNLIYSGEVRFGSRTENFMTGKQSIIFPFTDKKNEEGKYWIQGEKIITFRIHWGTFFNSSGWGTHSELVREDPELAQCSGCTAHVKYVLDK